jgi:hypothetical protein
MPFDLDYSFPLDPQALALEIEIPLKDWPLNCHRIACAVRDLVPVEGMRVVRGHYDGPIANSSAYRGGLQQHSWLELADGRVLDPTRWAMQSPSKPFIYLGVCDHYDDGGRAMSAGMPPPFPGTGPDFSDRIEALSAARKNDLAQALRTSSTLPRHLSDALVRTLKYDPTEIEDPHSLYTITQEMGLKAMIPLDSWQRIKEPEKIYCRAGGNRYFTLPPVEDISARDLIARLLVRFVSIEERGDRLESELAEHDITLDQYHDALNEMVDYPHMPLRILQLEHQFVLGIALMDILGQGFGNTLRIERYARSLGFDREGLHAAMLEVTGAFGLDVGWI